MSKENQKINAAEAVEQSLCEKRTVKIVDVDGVQELALNQICDRCSPGDATVDFWGVREGGEWHVCVIKETEEADEIDDCKGSC